MSRHLGRMARFDTETALRRALHGYAAGIHPAGGLERIRSATIPPPSPRPKEAAAMPSDDSLPVQVHPAGLLPGDILLADPDHPDQAVRWAVGPVIREERGGLRYTIAEYTTPDGAEGRHVFEDRDQWLTVEVRRVPGAAA
ncbi:hypothetical protein [Thermomonospora umbrina]|uniref:Uncharacterized protein n=1 Tax=Thermomonospora umbrina TaxID=111806 RepID=A0A3D9T926_9ACTN|nr:hypothetical protein [Thermomonospora umbrina]REF00262.1 hypothetical protein DFJ69_5791 [Thermomonospora umbrina]